MGHRMRGQLAERRLRPGTLKTSRKTHRTAAPRDHCTASVTRFLNSVQNDLTQNLHVIGELEIAFPKAHGQTDRHGA